MKKEQLVKLLALGVIVLFICMNVNPSLAVGNLKKYSMSVSNGNILYVGGSGPGNYTRIQDAINNATVGDIVFVYDDSSPYNESINFNKSIRIQGENMTSTIIGGWHSIGADYVIISNFTFLDYGPAVVINGFSNNMIENCVFDTCAGIELEKSNNNTIRNCSVCNCEFGSLSIDSSNNNEISYCDFFDGYNWITGYAAINIFDSRGIKIHHCNITRNFQGGVSVKFSVVQMTSNNIFNNDGPGVKLGFLSSCDLRNNWWGGPNGPNVSMYTPFFEMHWGLGPVYFKKVDIGESVVYGSLFSLIGINRVFPWFSEPVADAGQQTN